MSDWQSGGPAGSNGGGSAMARALALIQTDHLDEAKVICDQLLEADGNNVDALYALGWIALRKEEGEEALRLFGRVVERKSDHARAHNNLGTLLMTGGERAGAIRHFEAAVAAEPALTEAYGNLGSARLAEGQVDAARSAFERALELEPDDPSSLNNLASVKLRQGDLDGAVADYENVISKAPDFAEAHNNLANALRRDGRIIEALAALRRGLEANPDSANLITDLGLIHFDTGEFDKAIAEYDRVVAAHPNHRRAPFLRAFPLLALGRFEEGWTAYLGRPRVAPIADQLHRTLLDEDLSAATMVLRSEGSLAEDLQFLRFVPELARRGARVLISPGPQAAMLAQATDDIAGVAGQDDVSAALDVALGDLPHLLGMSEAQQIPPALKFEPEKSRVGAITARLQAAGPAPYIGVSWRQAGRAGTAQGPEAMPLEALGQALGVLGGTVILLQQGAASDAPARIEAGGGATVVDFSDLMTEPADTLALMAAIDHCITFPGRGLHLRLAAGCIAQVLVPWPTGYLFAGTAAASPWFPGCPLHRAGSGRSWDAALESLSAALGAEA